jgi:hypothetical protein
MTLVGAGRLQRFGLAAVGVSVLWLSVWLLGAGPNTVPPWRACGVMASVGAVLWVVGFATARRIGVFLSPQQLAAQQALVAQDAALAPDGLTSSKRMNPVALALVGVVVVFGGLFLLMLLLQS